MAIAKRPTALLRVLACCALITAGCDNAAASVTFHESPSVKRDLLTVSVYNGKESRTLHESEIGGTGREARVITTRTEGTFRLRFLLATPTSTVGEGSVEVPLRADWTYQFDILVDSINPTIHCMGCMGVRAFPLATSYQRSSRDSVFIVWGGNSISNPVTY